MKYKILITDPISDRGKKKFNKKYFELIDRSNSKDTVEKIIDKIHAWIIRSGTIITGEDIKKARNLQVIGRAGVGVDNINIDIATKSGIVVMNVPDGNSISAAEHTIAMMLALSRNLHIGHITLNNGKWERADLIGNELKGKVIGIVGLGKIGREVIDRILPFKVKVLGFDPYINKSLFKNDKVKIVDLDTLTKESDIISIHIPLNNSTKDLFDFKRIQMMKKQSKIINVARGGIINEFDLSKALNQNIISGAALDVFSVEPMKSNNPLLKAKNILLTPHLGASTIEAKEGVSQSICRQIIDFFNEQKLTNAINLPISDMSIMKKIRKHLKLSEVLGIIQNQLVDKPIKKIEINFYGSITEVNPISIAFIQGILSKIVDSRVNYVNAFTILKERGIEIIATLKPQTEKYANFIDTYVHTKDKKLNIGGSVFEKEMRVLKFMNHEINFYPEGHFLTLKNKDVPGVVGQVGTILGKENINIAEYILSRPHIDEDPISIIKIDQSLDQDTLEKLTSNIEIVELKQFKV